MSRMVLFFHVPRFPHLLFAALLIASVAGAPSTPASAQTPQAQSAASPASGTQSGGDESTRIRALLGAEADAKIQPAPNPKLTGAFPIKVFVATGLDVNARDNFNRWIMEWQKKESKKVGAIELVTDARQADVFLARFSVIERTTQELRNQSYPVVTTTDTDRSDTTGQAYAYNRKSSYSTGQRQVSVTVVPTYAYVIERGPDGFLVLTRDEAMTPVGADKNAGQPLWETFKKLLRQRADDAKRETSRVR